MNSSKDRFGFTWDDIAAEIAAHAGIFRAGCYIPTRHEVATLDLEPLYSVLNDWWWESPSSLIPNDEQVDAVIAVRAGSASPSTTVRWTRTTKRGGNGSLPNR